MRSIYKLITLSLILSCNFLVLCCSSKLVPKNKSELQISEENSLKIIDRIQKNRVIKVGTTGDYVPFSYQLDQSTDDYYGIDIELAKDLAKSLEVDLQFIKTSWPTLLSDLNSGKFDIGMSGITITSARQKQALFSIPLLSSGKAAITRDENVTRYDTLEEINASDVRIIVNPGGTNEAFAIKNFPNASIIQNKDNISVFQKIVDGKVDVMITDAIETLVQERIHPELDAVNADDPFNFFEMGYLLPKDEKFKTYVDQWLVEKQKEGTFQKVFDAELEKFSTATKQ